ncbi:MAG TPA: PHP domain-containing protein [Syntrophomonadaceae bacterium]|nr:PHP domain-containing protein [Syntrophomonadaceae bacterium]
MYYDLHIHSTASDGTMSPGRILQIAADIGLPGIALTDHDTLAGLAPAEEYLADQGLTIQFIPGIELNTDSGESELHILGYFIQHRNSPIQQHLEKIKAARYDRAVKMVERLRSMGLNINFDRVQAVARGDLIGRPHVAQALIEKGYVFSIKEAFQKYIGRGRPGYVPRYKFAPEEAIELVHRAGGISILAHPGLIKEQEKIQEMMEMGIEGLEVYYPEHTEKQVQHYYQLAREHNLLITGGSDFHGTGHMESRGRLGCAGLNQELFDELITFRNDHNK